MISLDNILSVMALMVPAKNGGRYTKREQEERRLKVHQLHFEENKSAVAIAEILNVNRNTVNDDINFWFRQIPTRINFFDVFSLMLEEINRKKIQRERLLEYLDEVKTIDEKVKIEKLIYDIGNKLDQFFSKVIFAKKGNLLQIKNEEIPEDEIKDFVRELIFEQPDMESRFIFSENELQFEIIKKTKCNEEYCGQFIQKMKELGLNLCKKPREVSYVLGHDKSERYELVPFAELRGYLTVEEFSEHFNPKKNYKKGKD